MESSYKDLDHIEVVGARENNLKDISLKIPRNKLVVITGLSGSGKSSLAFDTIFAEGQRRYMETLSSYARQFMGKMERPDVDKIDGLSPVISIEQKTTGWNPRSTVGTTTEVYDFLRLLYARIGEAYSYNTGKRMVKYTEDQLIARILQDYEGDKILVLAPLVRARKGHYRELLDQQRKKGYTKVRADGVVKDLVPGLQLDRYKTHDVEVVIDRIKVSQDRKDRLINAVKISMDMGRGMVFILNADTDEIKIFSKLLMCQDTGISYEEPSPNNFSFNSPYGTCPKCKGLGQIHKVDLDKLIPDDSKSINDGGILAFGEVRDNTTFKQLRAIAKKYKFGFSTPIKDIPEKGLDVILNGGDEAFGSKYKYTTHEMTYDLAENGILNMLLRWYKVSTSEKIRRWAEDFMSIVSCDACDGYRLKEASRHFKLGDKHIGELAHMDLIALNEFLEVLPSKMDDKQNMIATEVLKEIKLRVSFLLQVGLGYLNLDRPSRTLSGGESQRTRLATQIGSQLTGITYVMDEPSIGLHQRDNHKLIDALRDLADIGNTVLVVEHDKDIMMAADHLIDLGPGAGKLGGYLISASEPDKVSQSEGVTAEYLSNRKQIAVPKKRRKGNGKYIKLNGAKGHNLQNVNLKLPLGTLICVTGVSGSGKSSLINQTLYPILRQYFYKSLQRPLPYGKIEGIDNVDKVIEIDQAPIGRTPRSNPATYTGVFTDIRKIYTAHPESKIRGYKMGRFSFNVKGGRCETCQGAGKRVIEMNFLPNVHVDCEECQGMRYNRETREILFKGKSISDVLAMTVAEAVEFFAAVPNIYRKIKTLMDVGLGYITLGQQATTLSGGEAQRVKLAEELSKRDTGNTMYILDEPTTGLHFQDIQHLITVLNRLVDKGNTIVVIEHNMDVIKVADYIVDVGPEGGNGGGNIIFSGKPEQLIKKDIGHTARFLKEELNS